VDPRGRVWIEAYPGEPGKPSQLLVFNSQWEFEARIDLPGNVDLKFISRKSLGYVQKNADGVEEVIIWPLLASR
jgi:hypothetical protein